MPYPAEGSSETSKFAGASTTTLAVKLLAENKSVMMFGLIEGEPAQAAILPGVSVSSTVIVGVAKMTKLIGRGFADKILLRQNNPTKIIICNFSLIKSANKVSKGLGNSFFILCFYDLTAGIGSLRPVTDMQKKKSC